MENDQYLVYMEDLVGGPKPAKKVPLTETTETNVAVKRQRTLMEMFSGPSDAPTGSPSCKKQKLSPTQAVSSTTENVKVTRPQAAVQTFGLQPLNSIPFSLTTYRASLSEEQNKILALECETLGKSWCVHSHRGINYVLILIPYQAQAVERRDQKAIFYGA